MRKMAKENVIVVCTILLCIAFTITLCLVYSSDGLIAVFSTNKKAAQSFWMIVSSPYSDVTLARSSARMVKNRGGAGYVKSGESIRIVYAVYEDKESCDLALKRLGSQGVFVEEVEISECDFGWCDREYKQAVEETLTYIEITYDTLKNCADMLSNESMQIVDAKTQIEVLSSQIKEIKSSFYEKVENYVCEQIAQIKLALITVLALIDNIEYDDSTPLCVSSIRYALVQTVFCYQALMSSI